MSGSGGARKGAGRKAGSPNKATAFIREIAGKHAQEAIDTLVEMMGDKNIPAAARVSASRELIERGFGRSGSFVNLDLETPLSELEPAKAISKITDKVAEGKLSTEEGQRLVGLIEVRIKAVEVSAFEQRLSTLEKMKGLK